MPKNSNKIRVSDFYRKYDNSPLEATSDDQLDRRAFAEQLGQMIKTRISKSQKMRMMIHGKPGAGKTSTLNLVANEFSGVELIIFEKFTLGFYKDESQIFHEFYIMIARLCGISTTGLKNFAPYIDSFMKTAELASSIAVTPVMTGLLKELVAAAISGEKLRKEKDEIKNCLDQSEKKIIIAIDDFDCLSNDEIQAAFRFIRLAAEFSEIGFIVACDRERVVKTLAPSYGDPAGADGFLNALFTEMFELPQATGYALSAMAAEGLDYVLDNNNPAYRPSDERRKQSLIKRFESLFGHSLNTPREVKSYYNEVGFKIGPLAGEVDPLQFAMIEAIRRFYPGLYRTIGNYPEIFTGVTADNTGEMSAKAREIIEAALEDLPETRRLPLIKELALLFPSVAIYFNLNEIPLPSEAVLEKKQSIASKDYFYRYFDCRLRPDDISDKEIKEFFIRPRPENPVFSLRQSLANFAKSADVPLLLRKLRRTLDEIPAGRIEDSIAVLAHLGTQSSFNTATAESVQAKTQICNFIRSLLTRIGDGAQRDRSVMKIGQNPFGLVFACQCAMILTDFSQTSSPRADITDEKSTEEKAPILTKNGLLELYRNIAQTIASRNPNSKLLIIKEIFLPFCESWNKIDAASMREFLIGEILNQPKGAADFLSAAALSEFKELPIRISTSAAHRWRNRIEDIIEPEVLMSLLRQNAPELFEFESGRSEETSEFEITAANAPVVFISIVDSERS